MFVWSPRWSLRYVKSHWDATVATGGICQQTLEIQNMFALFGSVFRHKLLLRTRLQQQYRQQHREQQQKDIIGAEDCRYWFRGTSKASTALGRLASLFYTKYTSSWSRYKWCNQLEMKIVYIREDKCGIWNLDDFTLRDLDLKPLFHFYFFLN